MWKNKQEITKQNRNTTADKNNNIGSADSLWKMQQLPTYR